MRNVVEQCDNLTLLKGWIGEDECSLLADPFEPIAQADGNEISHASQSHVSADTCPFPKPIISNYYMLGADHRSLVDRPMPGAKPKPTEEEDLEDLIPASAALSS